MIIGQSKAVQNRVEKFSFIRSKYMTILFIFILMLTAIILSLTLFINQSLRLDESQSIWQASHSLSGILKVIAQDVHVPFYHFILHFWMIFAGNSVEGARIISLAFFVITIPFLYLLAKTSFNKRVALFAVFLFTLSPFMNWYSNEIRMYTLLTLVTVLNQLFFVRIIKKNRNADWYGYAITGLLGIFSHYFFFLNLFVQAVFFIIQKDIFRKNSFKKFALIMIMLAICFLPWVLYVLSIGGNSNTQPLIVKPSSVDFFNTFSRFIFGYQDDSINTVLLSMWPITILLGFLAIKSTRISENKLITYFIFCAFFPIIIAFLISITIRPFFLTRYLIVSLPALYILLSYLISTYSKKIAAFFYTLITLIITAMLMVQILNVNTPVKENYQQVSDYLTIHASPQDIIAISAPFTIYPIEYYYKGNTAIKTLPIWNREIQGSTPPFIKENLPAEVATLKEDHQNLWLVLSYDQGYEKDIKDYFDNHFENIEHLNYSLGLNLYKYKLRYDTK